MGNDEPHGELGKELVDPVGTALRRSGPQMPRCDERSWRSGPGGALGTCDRWTDAWCGAIVSTDEALTFTVLADPQGNKICICIHIGHSH